MIVSIIKPDGAKVPVRTMRELVEKANPKFYFCLAAESAFVFVGTVDEFRRDADLLDQNYGRWSDDYVPLMERKVIGYRKRDVPGEAGHMILIEGSERGPFWLRCEYEAFYKQHSD